MAGTLLREMLWKAASTSADMMRRPCSMGPEDLSRYWLDVLGLSYVGTQSNNWHTKEGAASLGRYDALKLACSGCDEPRHNFVHTLVLKAFQQAYLCREINGLQTLPHDLEQAVEASHFLDEHSVQALLVRDRPSPLHSFQVKHLRQLGQAGFDQRGYSILC